MQVNSVEDLDSFSAPAAGGGGAAAETATATPTPTTTAPAPTPATENPPKQSTIKIQSPPSKETKKDDSITVAMRQAGEQAASKAKDGNKDPTAKPESDSEKPQEGVNTEQKESEPELDPKAEHAGGAETHTEEQEQKQKQEQEEKQEENKTQDPKNVGPRPRRKSATPAPELAGNGAQRPPLATAPEGAAESTENMRADNAEALGLIEHHRGSIVSATSDEERSQVARDLRQSVSEARADAVEAQESCSLIEDDGDGGGMGGCSMRASVCC